MHRNFTKIVERPLAGLGKSHGNHFKKGDRKCIAQAAQASQQSVYQQDGQVWFFQADSMRKWPGESSLCNKEIEPSARIIRSCRATWFLHWAYAQPLRGPGMRVDAALKIHSQ